MFLHKTDFCLYIEQLKEHFKFDTYLETITYYIEHDTDMDYDKVVKALNDKILDNIRIEAMKLNMLKPKEDVVTL
jgi:hypothetical protein